MRTTWNVFLYTRAFPPHSPQAGCNSAVVPQYQKCGECGCLRARQNDVATPTAQFVTMSSFPPVHTDLLPQGPSNLDNVPDNVAVAMGGSRIAAQQLVRAFLHRLVILLEYIQVTVVDEDAKDALYEQAATQAGVPVICRKEPLENLDRMMPQTADAVVMLSRLQEVDNLSAFLKAVHRLLKPGGRCVWPSLQCATIRNMSRAITLPLIEL